MIERSTTQSWWKQVGRGLRENFRWYDGLTLLLGAVLGYAGNAFFVGDISIGASLFILGILTLCAVICISRFRVEVETKATTTLEGIYNEAIKLSWAP